MRGVPDQAVEDENHLSDRWFLFYRVYNKDRISDSLQSLSYTKMQPINFIFN